MKHPLTRPRSHPPTKAKAKRSREEKVASLVNSRRATPKAKVKTKTMLVSPPNVPRPT